MAGNVPNVSRNNFKYANLLTGGLSTLYDGVPLQQGVPVIDSDVNEMQDYQRMSKILDNMAIMGPGFVRFGMTSTDRDGFSVLEAAAPSNNFKIGDGFAAYGGVIVPSTTDTPPAEFDYNDQILYSGTLSAVAGADLSDADKNWTAADSLAASVVAPVHGACFVVIVNSANPAEIGHAATITTNTATKLTINTVTPPTGYTVINPANLAAGDTYQVKLPLLTTNGTGAPRTDAVYLQLWFEDINETEDPDILNVAVPVEAVHKIAKRWAVRVSEGSTVPTNSASDIYGFGVRYAGFATLSRPNATANILTAQITNTYDCFSGLSAINPANVSFDFTDLTALGYTAPAASDQDIQNAVDLVAQTLASVATGEGSALVGSSIIMGSFETVGAGTLFSQLVALVGHIEGRIESVNPTAAIGSPVPIFRSHNLSLTATTTVTRDVITVYLTPVSPTSARDCLVICAGCYLSGTDAITGTSGSLADYCSAIFIDADGVSFYQKDNPGFGTVWAYATASNWDKYFTLGAANSYLKLGTGETLDVDNRVLLRDELAFDGDDDAFMTKYIGSFSNEPTKIYTCSSTAAYAVPNMYAMGGKATTGAENGGWYLTHNVTWDAGGNVWLPINTSKDSTAMWIGPYGIRFYRMSANTAAYALGWALTAWDYSYTIGEPAADKGGTHSYFYSAPNIRGKGYERTYYHLAGGFSVGGSGLGVTLQHYPGDSINFRSRFVTTPSSIAISSNTETECTAPIISSITNWAYRIETTTTNFGATDNDLFYDAVGIVEVFN